MTRAPAERPARTLPPFTPVPRKCPRHDGWTPERQHAFIELLADYGSVRAAANAVGMTPESAYQLRRQPAAASFARAWQAAIDLGVQRIEDVAMERALNGVEVPVYCFGKLIGSRTVYNDRLLMFVLRNRAPHRFAGARANSLSALDKTTLTRLKKEWRKQWEDEQGLLQLQREAETIASINAKIDAMRAREEAAELLAARYADSPREHAPLSDQEFDAQLAAMAPTGELRRLLPGYREEEADDAGAGPRVRSVKEDGW